MQIQMIFFFLPCVKVCEKNNLKQISSRVENFFPKSANFSEIAKKKRLPWPLQYKGKQMAWLLIKGFEEGFLKA